MALSDVFARLLRGALKLLLLLAAGVFVFSLLLAVVVLVLVSSLWALVTGRKPAPVVLFGRLREQSKRYTRGVWPGHSRPAGDVVDVDATEVPSDPARQLR